MAARYPSMRSIVVISVLLILPLLFLSAACSQRNVSVSADDMEPTPTAVLAENPYSPSDGIVVITDAEPNTPPEGDPREPWLGEAAWIDGVQAGQEYIADYPEPQNVIVLQGMNTSEIWVYMQQHVSGALGVSCQYCHDIGNFSIDYPQKISSRLMMVMVNDLNRDFMTNLPDWRGNYVQCATCHNNQPVDLPAVSNENEFVIYNPPYDANDQFMANWIIDTPAIHPNTDYVHRHPSTGIMLAMTNAMSDNWKGYMLPRAELQDVEDDDLPRDNRQYYVSIDEKTYALPGCYTCHRGYSVPDASISTAYLEAQADGGFTILPPMLRGLEEESAQQE